MFPVWEEQTSQNAIYVELRRAIIMNHLKPGERLDVDAIAAQYNTSITPVRDALQLLRQDGLVTIKPRSGYFVTRTTLKQLRDLLDLRHILELAAVERAALNVTPEQLAEFRSIHAGYTGDDDLFIRHMDHRVVCLLRLGQMLERCALFLCRMQRGVRILEPEVDEEGLGRILFDEVDCRINGETA